MEALDPASVWLRLSERYRQMSDNELLALACQKSELTEAAQQILANVISHRGLTVQPEDPPALTNPEPTPDSSYAEERESVELCVVWSLRDALQVQTLLDRAAIPFYMGPEKATGVDAVTSNFASGVSVKIMLIGLPWARQAMQSYQPADEPERKPEEEYRELPVRCPKCHSRDVVFERLITRSIGATDKALPKFQWICDACGHQWEDEGIVREE